MTRIAFLQSIAGALFSLCLATVPARAVSIHTYVSGKGADTGACGHPAKACRTFAFAIGQTAASGTIIAIDPANYGPVTITKSIIVADGGGRAGIFITTGTAITINAGVNDIVNLRGLTLDGSGTASKGGGGSVTNTDCFVRHFKGSGIDLGGIGSITFLISNTVSADNAAGLAMGAFGPINGVVDHFTATGDNIGISVDTAREFFTNVTIVDSVMADNASDGLLVGAFAPNTGSATLAGSVVTRNGTGVESASAAQPSAMATMKSMAMAPMSREH